MKTRKAHATAKRAVSSLRTNQVFVAPSGRPERVDHATSYGGGLWLVTTDRQTYAMAGARRVKVFTGGWRGNAQEVAARAAGKLLT